MFEIGEYVVYGADGVCRVEAVGPLQINKKLSDRDYYTLSPVYSVGTRVFCPVGSDKVVMRRILSREETDSLIRDIPGICPLEIKEERSREEVYKTALRSCDCTELVKLIKTVRDRKQQRIRAGKKVTAVDERYFKTAEDQLYGELAIPLAIERSQVRDYIESYIQRDAAEANV